MTNFKKAYEAVEKHILNAYGITSSIEPVVEPNTGDFDGMHIKIDTKLDWEQSLFVLLHLFGHAVQWNISEEFRKLGQETVKAATDEQLKLIYIYEKQATQYSIKALHQCRIFDMDRWLSDWWGADWKWLERFYKTGEKLDQFTVRQAIMPGECEMLTPIAIPKFKPRKFESRWSF